MWIDWIDVAQRSGYEAACAKIPRGGLTRPSKSCKLPCKRSASFARRLHADFSLPCRFVLKILKAKHSPQQVQNDQNVLAKLSWVMLLGQRGRSIRSSHSSALLRVKPWDWRIPSSLEEVASALHPMSETMPGFPLQVAAHLNLASCYLESEACFEVFRTFQIFSSCWACCGNSMKMPRLQMQLWSMLQQLSRSWMWPLCGWFISNWHM